MPTNTKTCNLSDKRPWVRPDFITKITKETDHQGKFIDQPTEFDPPPPVTAAGPS